MPYPLSSKIEFPKGLLVLAAGTDDPDRGLRVGYEKDIYPRIIITPDGEIFTGDGTFEPNIPFIGGGASLRAVTLVVDGGGNPVLAGTKKPNVIIPFSCTITGWKIIADQAGSIQFDVWKDSFANYPPTVGDSITGSAPPALAAALKSSSSALTGWTTSITAGDILKFSVTSASTVTWVSVALDLAPL